MDTLRISLLLALLASTGAPLCGQSQPKPVWGFADLHTHPASHLAFGSDQNGENGLFWGKPAHDGQLDLYNSDLPANLASDLKPCPSVNIAGFSLGYSHNNATNNDPIKVITDSQIVNTLDGTSPGWTHQGNGYPSFLGPNNSEGWPSGLTVDHQVMHIDSVKRAFDGGLRLMFASVTNDEILSKLWNQGFNAQGNPMPAHDPSFDYSSAVTQLRYITNLVNANKTWMQIVTTPSQARAAINNNKLAVVLSLEMDSLSLPQVQALVQQFGVAHVIPIHLADNSFGGTALYSDTFNGLNFFINGSYYRPTASKDVNFLIATPLPHLEAITPSGQLKQQAGLNVPPSIITVGAVIGAAGGLPGLPGGSPGTGLPGLVGVLNNLPQGALGYTAVIPNPAPVVKPGLPGQINSKGLNPNQFLALMQMGLLLDVAHMGYNSASAALTLAQKYNYPVMDSHTGIRCDTGAHCSTPFGSPSTPATANGQGVNERSLPVSQVGIISQLGGVIGIGEVPAVFGQYVDPDPVSTWITNYSVALSLMGGKGVALGTDANGLSPLLQGDTIPMNYPVTVASQFGCSSCPRLQKYQLGSRTFDFQKDGIATYGMLPDFIQAASQPRKITLPTTIDPSCRQACVSTYQSCMKDWNPGDHPKGAVPPCGTNENACLAKCPRSGGGTVTKPAPTTQIAALFHTAEDTIEMWEKVEKALMITTPMNGLGGEAGTPYSATLKARGGTPPYVWGLQSGSLPTGLVLSQGGTISGTETVAKPFQFTVIVRDSAKPMPATSTMPFTMTPTMPACQKGYIQLLCGNVERCVANPPGKCPAINCGFNERLVSGECVPKGGVVR